jgi:hypothetical protein
MRKLGSSRGVYLAIITAALAMEGCQRPTAETETTSVDDFIGASAPATVTASPSTDGRTYRVVRNNETDLIVAYQFKVTFAVTVTVNSNATDKKYDLTFPITLAQASVKVNQASGGILTPPSGGDTERSEFVITQASGNKFAGASTSLTMNFDVWYTMPSQQKEALITVAFNMSDDDGKVFSKTTTINVAP